MNYEMIARKVYNEIVAQNLGATNSINLIEKELKSAVKTEREEIIHTILNCWKFETLKRVDFKTKWVTMVAILFNPVKFFRSSFKAMQLHLAEEVRKRDYL